MSLDDLVECNFCGDLVYPVAMGKDFCKRCEADSPGNAALAAAVDAAVEAKTAKGWNPPDEIEDDRTLFQGQTSRPKGQS